MATSPHCVAGSLHLRTEDQIVEFLGAWLDSQSPRDVVSERKAAVATRAAVPDLVSVEGVAFRLRVKLRRTTIALAEVVRLGSGDLAAAARASVQQATCGKGLQPRPDRCDADRSAGRRNVPLETSLVGKTSGANPSQSRSSRIAVSILRLASLAVVVFDAKEDPGAGSAGEIPDVMGIEDVTEVQVSRRRGREACEVRRNQDFAAFPARRRTACRLTGFVFRNAAHLSSPD